MGKHKHHIIPVYHCKELGIDPDFDENYVMVERLDHARIHWGYKCDDLEPLFEYITPEQWIIDLIPRGDNRDVSASVLIAKGEIDEIDMSGENHPNWKGGVTYEKLIFNRVFKELSRWPYSSFCYACCPKSASDCSSYQWRTTESCACTMPLWDDDYIKELDHENKTRETNSRISDGYDGLKDGEKLQASGEWEQLEGWTMNEQYRLPNLSYESIEDAYRDSGYFSSLISINHPCIHHSMWVFAETISEYTHKYP